MAFWSSDRARACAYASPNSLSSFERSASAQIIFSTAVAAFVGRSAPKFYYNIMPVPFSPHYAQIVVETRHREQVDALVAWVRDFGRRRLAEAEVVARKLEQGPPVLAPLEVRLFGEQLQELSAAANQVAEQVRALPGTVDVRHSVGPGAPVLRFRVDDAAAARFGLSRADVARTLYGRTRGLSVGELRASEDPVPVVLRASAGERLPVEDLETVAVTAPDGRAVPLGQIAHIETAWRPAVIRHHNTQRVMRVFSQLRKGVTFSDVLPELRSRLAGLDLPAGVSFSFGGEAEGAEEANVAFLSMLPIGLLLLVAVLLAEFNSFRRLGLVLVTVPLAATGVVPGLLLSGQPFGFMSLLGVFALVGIVVNNAIVLLEVVERRRAEGASIEEALADAVTRRVRPIFLTTATTIAGLAPLALSSSTLWPPLAWAIISGLAASSLLTLVVVPALYHVLFARSWAGVAPQPAVGGAVVGLLLLCAGPAAAGEALSLSLHASMQRGQNRPAAQAAGHLADAAHATADAERRRAYFPTVGVSLSLSDRNRELELVTPIGNFPFGSNRVARAGLEVVQPLLDPGRMFYGSPAARAEAGSARHVFERTRRKLAAAAGLAHTELLRVDVQSEATRAYVASLEARLAEMEGLARAGRALEADVLKVRLALEQARQELVALRGARDVALADLAQSVGHDGLVLAQDVPDWSVHAAPPREAALERALAERADLAARRAARDAVHKRRGAVRAERLPRVEARMTWSWTDGSPYSASNWAEGGVALTWVPFAAGTRKARLAALEARRQALEAQLGEARRSAGLEVQAALAAIETSRAATRVGARAVQQAHETLRVERERHLAGRATTNDLLEAEAVHREQVMRLELARIDVVRAWIRLWLAGGDDGRIVLGDPDPG